MCQLSWILGFLHLDSISYASDEVLHKSKSLYPRSTVFCCLLALFTVHFVWQMNSKTKRRSEINKDIWVSENCDQPHCIYVSAKKIVSRFALGETKKINYARVSFLFRCIVRKKDSGKCWQKSMVPLIKKRWQNVRWCTGLDCVRALSLAADASGGSQILVRTTVRYAILPCKICYCIWTVLPYRCEWLRVWHRAVAYGWFIYRVRR